MYRSLLKSFETEAKKLILIRLQLYVLFGVYLLLHYVYPNDIDIPRQNNNMIRIVL